MNISSFDNNRKADQRRLRSYTVNNGLSVVSCDYTASANPLQPIGKAAGRVVFALGASKGWKP